MPLKDWENQKNYKRLEMCKTKMKRGIMYIVTKGSDDGHLLLVIVLCLKMMDLFVV